MTDPQWPTYEPEPAGPEPRDEGESRPPEVTHQAAERPKQPKQPHRPRRRRPTGLLVWLAVMVAGGAATAAVFALADRDGVPGLGKPDAQSAEGLEQLRDDVRERTGRTEVFRAVIYPEYASVDVPVDATSQREETLFWDGDLDDSDSKGTSSYTRVDLADVDAEVVADAIRTAKTLVEDPTTWYVIVEGASTNPAVGDRASLSAYASNEYSESGYVELDFDGTEIRRYASTDQR